MTGDAEPSEAIVSAAALGSVVIYLIGIPAVGKYTIAKEIGRLTGAKVVDNQLINLPVFSVLGYDGKDAFPFPQGAWQHIERIREAVFTVISEFCSQADCFVFTNVLDADDDGDEALFQRIERLASERNAEFFPVWLTCDAETLRGRKDSPDRRARFKDTDLTNIDRYVKDSEILEVPHANALTLDTSVEDAETVAGQIIAHVESVQAG